MLTTGCVSRSPHSTTIRFETIAARRSSSSSTTFFSDSMVERHLDHADRALDQGLARRDHRLRLLAAKHRAGDLLRISEVGEAAFVDRDPGDREPRLELGAELGPDLVVVAAQRDFQMLEIVIGIARADGPDRGFDLDPDELLVIVDVEQRLRGVDDAPHDLRRHLDRVAAQVVDLDLLGNEIVGADRHLLLRHPRPDPAQAGGAVGAVV